MTLTGPIALQTIGIAAAALAGLIVVAYILKMRRRRFEVPFSILWQRVLRERETTSLWRRLKRWLSLLLVLAIVGLLVFAATGPQLGGAPDAARTVVIVIDASASMKARDSGPDTVTPRIETAKLRAHEIVSGMSGGDTAMIMRMDGQASPLTRFESDPALLHRAIDSIAANDTPADLRRALTAAADSLRDRHRPLVVLIGDGAYPAEVLDSVAWERPAAAPASEQPDDPATARARLDTIDVSGIDVRYLQIGASGDNLGIVAFNVRRYIANKASYEVFVEVQNFNDVPAKARLTLYSGKLAVSVKTLDLAAGERVRQLFPGLSGGEDHRLRARLEPLPGDDGRPAPRDVFPLDNEAFALLPARKRQDVLLVTQDNLYLEGAMLVYDNIRVDKLTPGEFDTAVAARSLPDYHAIVFDDFTPPAVPDGPNLMYFNPEGEHSPVAIAGSTERPRITELAEDHPVMRWVVMTDVNFDRSSVFRVDPAAGEVALAKFVRSPLVVAKQQGARKIVVAGFSLTGTDLMMRVAFPLLLVNVLDWFAGDDSDLITTYTTGRRFRVAMDGTHLAHEVDVRDPVGGHTRAPASDGAATFYGTHVGVHVLTLHDDDIDQDVSHLELAANLASAAESDIRPPESLTMGGVALAAPETFEITPERALWRYLALLFVLLLGVEWITYHRRLTV